MILPGFTTCSPLKQPFGARYGGFIIRARASTCLFKIVDEMLFKIRATLKGESPLPVEGFSIIFACMKGFIIKGFASKRITSRLPAVTINQFFKISPVVNSISPQYSRISNLLSQTDLSVSFLVLSATTPFSISILTSSKRLFALFALISSTSRYVL